MVNTEIRLIIFFALKDREALYSQQNQDRKLTVVQIMIPYCQIQTEIEESMAEAWTGTWVSVTPGPSLLSPGPPGTMSPGGERREAQRPSRRLASEKNSLD